LETLDSVIATLNNLGVGALDKIEADLGSVRKELERRGLKELVEKVDSCQKALFRGDLAEFRRLRETLVSRLGHLRQKIE
jgi:hypothetical protein